MPPDGGKGGGRLAVSDRITASAAGTPAGAAASRGSSAASPPGNAAAAAQAFAAAAIAYAVRPAVARGGEVSAPLARRAPSRRGGNAVAEAVPRACGIDGGARPALSVDPTPALGRCSAPAPPHFCCFLGRPTPSLAPYSVTVLLVAPWWLSEERRVGILRGIRPVEEGGATAGARRRRDSPRGCGCPRWQSTP